MIGARKNSESRIEFAAGVLLLSTALILGAILFSFEKERYLSQLKAERRLVEIALIRHLVSTEKTVSSLRGKDTEQALREIASHEKILGAGLYDPDGRLIAQDVQGLPPDFENQGFPPDLPSGGEPNDIYGDGRVAILTIAFENERGKVVHISVVYSVERIASEFSESTAVLFSALAASVIFVYFTTRMILERTVTEPMRKLTETVRSSVGRDFPVSATADAKELENALLWFKRVSEENAAMKREFSHLNMALEEKVKERTRQSDEANKAKTAFLANVSHELRTPLNAILGFTNIIGQKPGLSEETMEQLGIVRRSGEYLLLLINEILDLSKIEAGQMELNEEPMDLRRLLWELENIFGMKAASKNLELAFELDENLPCYIVADELKLRQIIANLIDNAVKFTDKGRISLRARVASRLDENVSDGTKVLLRFEVEDTGAGIASEEKKDLFKAFVQTRSGQRSRQGTGLGLAISAEFVKMMKGEIVVESTPGKGSSFFFAIPLSTVSPDEIEGFDDSNERSRLEETAKKGATIPKSGKTNSTGGVGGEIPPDLWDELEEAARTCEIGEVEKCIRQIRAVNSVLADELSALAADYKYDAIIDRIGGNRQ